MSTWKPNTLETIKDFLEKARRRLSDENPDYADMDDEQDPEGLDSEFSEDEEDDADRWLRENDTSRKAGNAEPSEEADEVEAVSEPEPPKPVSKPEPKSASRAVPVVRKPAAAVSKPAPSAPTTAAAKPASDDELQPTREELAAMREYTRPWERHARDRAKLEAEAHVNPVRHHQGRLVEARNTSHADRQKAYEAFSQSPEFQNADPITQMEMEAKFHEDWHKQNPDHLMNALNAHHEAHKKGGQAMQVYNQAKDEKIRHIAGGGAQGDAMSLEEGMQHVGGSRDDEDSGPSGIQQDKGAAFAAGNQEFMQQYMKNYDKKAKKFSNVSDMDRYDPETRADINTVLGEHPALKDPAKKRQVDRFVEKYHPQIGKAARHVLAKLGLTDKANRGEIDHGLLHEAGVHALFQAVNDYDHDHPSKAKFTTHLSRKMHGLMQSALKAQDEIPDTLRAGAKQFDRQRRNENAAPVKHTNKEGVTTMIYPGGAPPAPATPPPATPPKRSLAEIASEKHPDMQDRLKRVTAAKAPLVRKQSAVQPKPATPPGPKMNVRFTNEDGEE